MFTHADHPLTLTPSPKLVSPRDRLSIYTASILSVGFVCYLLDEKLFEFESYVNNASDFPMGSSKIHGIYPINAPREEASKLKQAPTLLKVNKKKFDFDAKSQTNRA